MDERKNTEELAKSYEYCRKIMRDRAKSFYEAFRQLPEERFSGVAALYAFNRYADDLADGDSFGNPPENPLLALEKLENHLRTLYHGGVQSESPCLEPFWLAFEDTVSSWGVPLSPLLLQLEGQKSDVVFDELVTMKDLMNYSRKVAGSVGLMMVPLLAADEKLAEDALFLKACEDLGIGMQLTNILRDVGEDLRERGRVYLPTKMLRAHGLDQQTLFRLSTGEELTEDAVPQSFITLAEDLMSLADGYYESIRGYLSYFHPAARTPLLAAALLYQGIHGAIRRSHYNVFTKRCYTDALTRAKLVLKAKGMVDLL